MGRNRKYNTDEERRQAMNEAVKRYRETEKGKMRRYINRRDYYAKTAYAPNHKRVYTDAECIIILAHRIPDIEIARNLGRSVAGIQRKRYGLMKKLAYTE